MVNPRGLGILLIVCSSCMLLNVFINIGFFMFWVGGLLEALDGFWDVGFRSFKSPGLNVGIRFRAFGCRWVFSV